FQPKTGELEIYRLNQGRYEQQKPDENNRYWIAEINLFLGVWQGKKADVTAYWLRWWELSGNLLLWGSELVEQENERAAQERQRAEQAELELEQERISRQRLVQKLKELGVNPENL
ncbi:MAG: hypothetical protein ACKPGW_33165, partial [Microcystis panniformis]